MPFCGPEVFRPIVYSTPPTTAKDVQAQWPGPPNARGGQTDGRNREARAVLKQGKSKHLARELNVRE